MKRNPNPHPETILFVGAGATQTLAMPTSSEQAKFLWNSCNEEPLTTETIESSASCFKECGDAVALMAFVLDSGADGNDIIDSNDNRWRKAFPGIASTNVEKLVRNLRRHYDWGALKLIAKAKKGSSGKLEDRGNYLQEVFTLMDVCIRDRRGFEIDINGEMVFLPLERIKAAYETLTLLINTMFACSWRKLIETNDGQEKLKSYRRFILSLASLMQKEARTFEAQGCAFNKREFYQLSYSLVTTNFEPLFLWFIWMAHKEVNKGIGVRLGNPGRMLKLLMNFPNSVGMRKPADDGEELSSDIWFPCTEAVAQNVNNPKYTDNRVFRLGKYFPVHGMSVTRHCPKCGRLNLYMGDTWDKDSKTLFPNGIIAPFKWGQEPRTEQEESAHNRGEYDALECHFCGALTHSYDNFMFMQTQLKQHSPSFIREATDEALADITHAKHIVLLGYSMPLDDAIWGSLLSMMSRRKNGERLYCSVVATYDPDGPKGWLYEKALEDYLASKDDQAKDKEKVRAINNAIAVFGKENVRAYVQGIPNVFGEGTESDVVDLLYPYNQPGWDIKVFTSRGVIREVK